MKAYISISYNKRQELNDELQSIIQALKELHIKQFVFVDNFKFSSDQEKEMMQQAIVSIDDCDLLIAETSDKGIGIGVEAGYAKAKGKPVIYMRNRNAEHSTTVAGISDFQIIYDDIKNLREQLTVVLSRVINFQNKEVE
ncbi:MAG TPA: nucleoside 2-deoxyribosyltransferase [Chitinophagaceae bacterium]|nr:nucleoside 2-deoxyribosyltransferase [Chitinophagaceae bacterium]